MPSSSVPGRSYVTRRAIVEIVRKAALGSYGVTSLADPRPSRRALARLGLGAQPILVTLRPSLGIELSLTIAYGLPVAEVVRQVEFAVRHAIWKAIGVEVGSIVVHVNGLREAADPAPATPAASPPHDAAPVLAARDESASDAATDETAGTTGAAEGEPSARPVRRRRRSGANSPSAAPR